MLRFVQNLSQDQLQQTGTGGVWLQYNPLELLEAQRDVALCIHVVYVNGLPFLAAVSLRLMQQTAEHIPARSQEVGYASTRDRFQTTEAGFMIGTVHSDPEFIAVQDKVETTLAAKVTYWRTAEHVPEAENNNLVIHERTRETFHQLPCQILHETALIELIN